MNTPPDSPQSRRNPERKKLGGFSARLPEATHELLSDLATATDQSLNQIITDALMHYVKNYTLTDEFEKRSAEQKAYLGAVELAISSGQPLSTKQRRASKGASPTIPIAVRVPRDLDSTVRMMPVLLGTTLNDTIVEAIERYADHLLPTEAYETMVEETKLKRAEAIARLAVRREMIQ